jgi:hypothetical protein
LPKLTLRFEGGSVELTSRFSALFQHHGKGQIRVQIEGKECCSMFTTDALSRCPAIKEVQSELAGYFAAVRAHRRNPRDFIPEARKGPLH